MDEWFKAVVDDMNVLLAFRRIVEMVGSPDDIYRDWGEGLLISTRQRVQDGVSPDGTPFVGLKKSYAAEKAKAVGNRPILIRDFHMVGDRFVYQIDQDGLLIGTGSPQGRAMQYGYPEKGIPARPWLGLSDSDKDLLKSVAADHLLQAIRRRT